MEASEPSSGSLRFKLATAQFSISADIEANKQQVLLQMREAHAKGCDAIHFPECALSGYGGSNFSSWEGYDWPLLRRCTEEVLDETRTLNGLWVCGWRKGTVLLFLVSVCLISSSSSSSTLGRAGIHASA
jgi:hypothetical protein